MFGQGVKNPEKKSLDRKKRSRDGMDNIERKIVPILLKAMPISSGPIVLGW